MVRYEKFSSHIRYLCSKLPAVGSGEWVTMRLEEGVDRDQAPLQRARASSYCMSDSKSSSIFMSVFVDGLRSGQI